MAEELLEFENTIEDPDGASWVARVLGAERPGGTWTGWIRFRDDQDRLVETERETTQPNRDDLVYWAKGLTYFYLEGALARARRRAGAAAHEPDAASDDGGSDAAAPGSVPTAAAPEESGPRLEVMGAPDGVIEQLMGAATLRPGTIKEVPDAGVLVYEGSGDEGAHFLALRFSTRNTGAVLSNWLWSRLHGTGATVHVNGQRVELSQDALSHAIVGE